MAGLAHLRLRNFRNFRRLDAEFPAGVCLLHGANGQGKTNLLESIYFLAILRSFRTRLLRNLCNWDADAFFVGCILRQSRVRRLAVRWSPRRRVLKADSRKIVRATEFVGHVRCVALAPEDITIVRGAAAERRRFLDMTLSQSDPMYLGLLRDYRKVLRLRNEALRNPGRYRQSLVAAYDDSISRLGGEVLARRVMFLQCLNRFVDEMWRDLAPPEWGPLSVEYASTVVRDGASPDAGEMAEQFRKRLGETRTRDEKEGGTTTGPHRDEVRLVLNGRMLSEFGSEGQCRIAAIALKLAAAASMGTRGKAGESDVVLLVDDVFGELDERRRKAVMERVTDAAQAFIVCPEGTVLPGAVKPAEYRVRAGTLERVR